jgi:hypothetical protein
MQPTDNQEGGEQTCSGCMSKMAIRHEVTQYRAESWAVGLTAGGGRVWVFFVRGRSRFLIGQN